MKIHDISARSVSESVWASTLAQRTPWWKDDFYLESITGTGGGLIEVRLHCNENQDFLTAWLYESDLKILLDNFDFPQEDVLEF